MNDWYKSYRLTFPSNNIRLNSFELDLRCNTLNKFNKLEEVILYNIDTIKKNCPGPYSLFVSGGIDSQVMLHCWLLSGEKFNAIHYSYNQFNDYETEGIYNFCKKFNIDLTIINFDALGFITSSELEKYATKYDCVSPQILTHIKMAEQHPETVIFSGNFIKTYHSNVNYTIHGLSRFSNITKKNFIPFFLKSTPEMGYAFTILNNQIRNKILHDTRDSDEYLCKVLTYKKLNFPIIEQTEKMTGFEKIKMFVDSYYVDRRLKIKYKHMLSKRPFDLLFRYKLFDSVGYYNDTTHCLTNDLSTLLEYNPLGNLC